MKTPIRAALAKAAHSGQPRDASSVERLVVVLRERAMRYEFRPGERINEQALGREIGTSRPPLREALNRLVAEGFLGFVMNRGFFRKSITAEEVFDLYQVRIALERRALYLAVGRAIDTDIAALDAFWAGVQSKAANMSAADLLLADEEFHRRMVALAGNKELSAFLEQVTRRIHVARYIDLEQSDWNERAFEAHHNLGRLLAERDLDGGLAALTEHIDMSLKRAVSISKEMVARFFLADHGAA
ncbi:MAG: GntR family transcriptional regulator [Caldimonas sp.]